MKKKPRENPYPNKIYEYELKRGTEEDWIRYNMLLSKASENFEETTKDKPTKKRLKYLYKIIENTVELLFYKKEAFKSEDERKQTRKNKIPAQIRTLMRKKSSLSKQIIASNTGGKTFKFMKELNLIEEELDSSY